MFARIRQPVARFVQVQQNVRCKAALQLARPFVSSAPRQADFTPHTMASSAGPLERVLESKIRESLAPTYLSIHNDSHLHAHHAAMKGNTSPETHFRVTVVSEAFEGKMQPARHRMVYALVKEEMARQGGLHALQLVTRTPKELAAKEKEVNERIEAEEAAIQSAEAQ